MQPRPGRPRRPRRPTEPAVQVMAVFDPDGLGGDFAYTVGLVDLGAPFELHVWARPTDGTDPGWDYRLSPEDCAWLLNRGADELLDGDLQPGGGFVVPLDGGAATARFVLSEPGHRDDHDAYMAEGPVATLRWELHR